MMPPLFFQRKVPSLALARQSLCIGALLGLALALPGCGFVGFPGVYKIDIEQGNLVDQEMVDQLQPGMSRRQVRFIMGSPLVEDSFNPDRWDYPYVIRNGQDIIREAQVTLVFEGDLLRDIRGDYLPEWARPGVAAPDEASLEPGMEPGMAPGMGTWAGAGREPLGAAPREPFRSRRRPPALSPERFPRKVPLHLRSAAP
jgi:outer membrane protein assembly factor BamE